ncbi:MAG: serine hydrolase domain-containing protein [Flavobacteriaceae bacterium]
MTLFPFKTAVFPTLTLAITLSFMAMVSSCGQSQSKELAQKEPQSTDTPPTLSAQIDSLMKTYAAYGRFNGSVLVSLHGKVVYKKGFGYANNETHIPNKSDTKFRIASITKQFTAMAIMQLVHEKKLSLTTPITTYLTDYPRKTGDSITIHHLLTHTSGIPNFTSFPNYKSVMRQENTPSSLVTLFANEPLEFSPGTPRFHYSNSNYIVLGAIIEKVTGKTYEQVIQEKIFTPLGMTNSGYEHEENKDANTALGYDKQLNQFLPAHYIHMSTPFAAGGLYSTAEDLFLWDQALYTEKLLPKSQLDQMFYPYTPYYGYGWDIDKMAIGNTSEEIKYLGHSGGINGFHTLITRFPETKNMVVLLNNTSGAPLLEITQAITGILHNKPFSYIKQSITTTLEQQIKKEGFETAMVWYQKTKDSSDYYHDENELNLLAYTFMETKEYGKAAAICRINIQAFPEAFNPYDSYAEALLAMNNKHDAIENYIQSVRLNTGNKNALRILKELGVDTDTLLKTLCIPENNPIGIKL